MKEILGKRQSAISLCILIVSVFVLIAGISLNTADAVWDGTYAESFAAGEGTQESPYTISNESQLAYFVSQVNSGVTFEGKYINLTSDMDMSGYIWESGNGEFAGTFDGDYHTITSGCRFLNTIGTSGIVKELYYRASSTMSTPLVCNTNNGTITNCGLTVKAYASTYLGCICFTNNGSIAHIAMDGSISGGHVERYTITFISLVCSNRGIMQDCYSSVIFNVNGTQLDIPAVDHIARTVDSNYNSTIRCYQRKDTLCVSNGYNYPNSYFEKSFYNGFIKSEALDSEGVVKGTIIYSECDAGHDWQETTYAWSEDNSSCTASRVCSRDASHVEQSTATITSEITKEATGTEIGEKVLTATFSDDWAVTQTKTITIPTKVILDQGTCGTGVSWILTDDGLLTISGSGRMADYSSDSVAPWYSKRTIIVAVEITEGVTSVGDCAFYSLYKLSSVNLPEGITSIGSGAFGDCTKLARISLPEDVTFIGLYAFFGCSSLASINIPEGVTSIQEYTFNCCSSLTSIVIPESVKSIGISAFYGCSSLTSIIIPEGVTIINESAFRGCSSLVSIIIPEGVNFIGVNAFNDCSSLVSITIPEGVTAICDSAFADCSSLTSINIPESVNSIRNSSFSGCSSLVSITIPEGVTAICDSAFADCSSLTSINIPESVNSIRNSSFSGCSSLVSITIPEGITTICGSAFYECSSLTSISIPVSVTAINENAFMSCYNLTDVFYTGSAAEWKSITIGSGNICLKNATIHHDHTDVFSAILTDTGRSLSLMDITFVNQYCTIETELSAEYIQANGGLLVWGSEISEENATYDNAIAANGGYRVEGLKKNGNEYYQQSKGVAPKNFSTTFYLRLYIQLEDGSYVYTPLKTYSINTYCNNIINKQSSNQKTINLVNAMLAYGAAASDYFA